MMFGGLQNMFQLPTIKNAPDIHVSMLSNIMSLVLYIVINAGFRTILISTLIGLSYVIN